MNLDLINNILNDAKNNKIVQSFIKELENYLNNDLLKNCNGDKEMEDILFVNSTYNENKITVKYRDKMLAERANILNNYAKETLNKGEMYYIYSNNSKMTNVYNLCICENGKSHVIIEMDKNDLPDGVKIGSVLRKFGDSYILDNESTKDIAREINNMEMNLLKEQKEFLKNKRIEGHIYEVSEKNEDRVWLFDITNDSNEGIEEIDFPTELIPNSKEGDLFIYKNGEYQKYQK